MHIERFFIPGLAHASYLIASGNEAVVVDPERNVDGYIAHLAQNKLKPIGNDQFAWCAVFVRIALSSGIWDLLSSMY